MDGPAPGIHRSLPSGTVTLVFTDIQGSSDLWESHGAAFKAVLDEHNRLIREATARWEGVEIKTEGDAFFLAFARASDAVQFAVDAQLGFRRCNWSSLHPELGEIRVRIGIHTGEPILAAHPDGTADYFGPVVNRAAHICAAGHGEQILLSDSTCSLARSAGPPSLEFVDLGQHRLKGVGWEQLWQVQHPDLPQQFPPLKTMNAARHNLPVQPNAFIGRHKEIAEIQTLLSESRLLTLTGSGGTGKTRLAIRAAEEVLSDFPDGIFFVPLEVITDPALVPSAIAQSLGLREESRRPLLDTIKDYLREKAALLLLDNFEHVLPAAPIIAQLLEACPRITAEITSRAPLQIRAERQYAVPTLNLPNLKNLPPIKNLSQYEAVALFIQRAVSIKSDFAVTNENAPAVAEICHRLDGLPLAIELAAARVKLLSPQAILPRLENGLALLTGGGKDRTTRQQTLRGAIAWSHDLLDDQEKALFRRLSVFVGGCTLEAAETLAGTPPVHQPSEHQPSNHHPSFLDSLDVLTSLVDKSLVLQEEIGGQSRFRMLETIREFARERLQDSGEAGDRYLEHAAHFLQLAQDASAGLRGPDQAECLDQLEREHGNFRAALGWALGRVPSLAPAPPGETSGDLALKLAGLLGAFWETRGYWREGIDWLDAVLALPGVGSGTERARCLLRAGGLRRLMGEYAAARSLYEKSLAISRETQDRRGIANALQSLGTVAGQQGDYSSARSLYEESLMIHRELGERRGAANSLNNLGLLAYHQGEYHAARSLYEESLAIQREMGDRHGIASSLSNLGLVAQLQGDSAEARSLHEESLLIRRELGERQGIAHSLNNLGVLAQERGDQAAARSLNEESLAIQRELGDRRGIAISLGNLGTVARNHGDDSLARTLFNEGLSVLRELGDRWGIAYFLDCLGALAASGEQWRTACCLLSAADTLREAIGGPRYSVYQTEHDRILAMGRDALGEDTFTTAWNEGCALSLDQAIELALKSGP